jgi:hypothetical protein
MIESTPEDVAIPDLSPDELDLCEELEVEIDGIEQVFNAAEEMRQDIVRAFEDECLIDDIFRASGGVRQRAYWGWESVIQAQGVTLGCHIEFSFEGSKCEYAVSLSRLVGQDQLEELAISDECLMSEAVHTAYQAFLDLMAEMCNEESERAGREEAPTT